LDIVGRDTNSAYIHKAWTGTDWYPGVTDWLDLGGNFSSAPAIVSWGPNRIDIFGISAKDGAIKHKYWNGDIWVPTSKDWEDLGGGPFIGDPVVSSWGESRFDIWAVDENGALNHKFWDGWAYQGWENLQGKFSTAPQVVHWSPGKIDIVGKVGSAYTSKAFVDTAWYPSFEGWYDKGGDFASDPAIVVQKGASKYRFVSIFPSILGLG
jgi:Repeat of unknown function (DUF346)